MNFLKMAGPKLDFLQPFLRKLAKKQELKIVTIMTENRISAQPFSKNSRFFQSFTPNLKFSEGVEQLGKYDVKLAEKFAQTITCLSLKTRSG